MGHATMSWVEKVCATEHDAVVAGFWTGWEQEIDDF